jgi:GT2 family glycosyltransferase/glycosyltransferase involved in cell wall biosynthesis
VSQAALKLTIAICTYDRPEDLDECLRAIGDLGYAQAHEVLVVDNSDSMDARRLNEKLTRACSGAKYLLSEPPGLSRARNVALAAASGDVVAFIDDDATCLAGWAEAVLAGFEDDDVVCVGGPILPRWEAPPPEWLGGELMLSLAVMDRGPEARDLQDDEFFYGANCAFRREALAAAGGFAEHLGRAGGNLMGDEEIDVQRKLKVRGRSRHVPGARVLHLVHAERCTLPWFLKRYAWQGLSDARSGDARLAAWLGTLLQPSELPSAGAFVSELFGPPRSTEDVVARARFVRGVVAALLDDRVPVPGGTRPAPERTRSIDGPEFLVFKGEVPGATEILFVEFGVSHSYLYDVYGRIPGASLINPKLDPSRQPRECAQFLNDAVFYASRSGVKAVVLLTADVLTWPGFEGALAGRSPGVEVFGFLHRPPFDAVAADRFGRVLPKVTGLFVFSEAVRRHLEEQFGARSAVHVPHPPVFFANAKPREPRRWREGAGRRVSLGLLGEVRPGKGYEYVLTALSGAPARLRQRLKLLMAGRAEEETERRIRDACVASGLPADLTLRSGAQRGYRAIPDNIFAATIAACDIMVFPFERDHWHVQSGHFADALVAGCWFLASQETVIGDLVEQHGIGRTFEFGDPSSFRSALQTLLADVETGSLAHSGRSLLLEEHDATHACRAVEAVLRGGAGADATGTAAASLSRSAV